MNRILVCCNQMEPPAPYCSFSLSLSLITDLPVNKVQAGKITASFDYWFSNFEYYICFLLPGSAVFRDSKQEVDHLQHMDCDESI